MKLKEAKRIVLEKHPLARATYRLKDNPADRPPKLMPAYFIWNGRIRVSAEFRSGGRAWINAAEKILAKKEKEK